MKKLFIKNENARRATSNQSESRRREADAKLRKIVARNDLYFLIIDSPTMDFSATYLYEVSQLLGLPATRLNPTKLS